GGWVWENPQAQSLFVLPEGIVRSIRAGSNRFTLETESATGGTVISSVSYAPGWQVEMDGRRSPAFEVNSAFLGFRVPPGRHAVRLIYRPASWTLGLVLFGLGVAASLAAALLRFTARRQPSPEPGGPPGTSPAC
ncbi:MAG TPA: YfhO family protein, partial [Thermoanaerobaculia bacterium]